MDTQASTAPCAVESTATPATPSWPPPEMVLIFDPKNPPKQLSKKLAEAVAAMKRVKKNGTNDYNNYKYATESDVVDALREEVFGRGIMVYQTLLGFEMSKATEKSNMVTARYQFLVIDSESGEYVVRFESGTAADSQPFDKALYKANTGANKYFWFRLMQVATGDDPETDSDSDNQTAPKQSKSRTAAPKDEKKKDDERVLKCNDCGKGIVAMTSKDGKGDQVITGADKVAARTKAKFGVELCGLCGIKRGTPGAEPAKPAQDAPASDETANPDYNSDMYEALDGDRYGIQGKIVEVKSKEMTKADEKKTKYRKYEIFLSSNEKGISTFSDTLGTAFTKAKGKYATIVAIKKDGKYLNLDRVMRIDGQPYGEDNKPELDQDQKDLIQDYADRDAGKAQFED